MLLNFSKKHQTPKQYVITGSINLVGEVIKLDNNET